MWGYLDEFLEDPLRLEFQNAAKFVLKWAINNLDYFPLDNWPAASKL